MCFGINCNTDVVYALGISCEIENFDSSKTFAQNISDQAKILNLNKEIEDEDEIKIAASKLIDDLESFATDPILFLTQLDKQLNHA